MIEIYIVLVVIIVLTIAFFTWNYYSRSHTVSGGNSHSELIDRLQSEGWVLYTMKGCGHCVRQKAIIDFPSTDASEMTSEEKKITDKFPSWYNVKTKTLMLGMKTIDQLKTM